MGAHFVQPRKDRVKTLFHLQGEFRRIWINQNTDLYSLGDISWERNMQYIPRGGFAPKRDILYQYIEGLPEVYWWNIQRESKLDRSKSDKSSEIRRIKDDLLDLDLSSWDSSWIFPIFLEHWNVTLWIYDLYTNQITWNLKTFTNFIFTFIKETQL